MFERVERRRGIGPACLVSLALLMPGCGGGSKSSAGSTSAGPSGTSPTTTSAAAAPGSRRFLAGLNSRCSHAGRGRPTTLPPKDRAALTLYARRALGPASATLRELQASKPPSDARGPVVQLEASYAALVPALQQSAAGTTTAASAPALTALERQASGVAQAAGLPGCAPFGS
jgi:hypothetical protein